MAIAKRPSIDRTDTAKKVTKFITGVEEKPDAKRVSALIRFDRALLQRVDAAAKQRGISRAAWIQFVVSRALDAGDG